MNNPNQPIAEAAMLIRKPVAEVFEAFVNPDITTKFWFTKSTGKLVEGKHVKWTWEMYDVSTDVFVKSIIPNKKIILEWGEPEEKTVAEWTFKTLDKSRTFVRITESGYEGTADEIIVKIRDSTGGFTIVLAGLKAYLEQDIRLNLVGDRFPKEMRED